MDTHSNLPLPDWLSRPPPEEPYSMTPLEPSLALMRLPDHPRTSEERQLVHETYEKVFYLSLDKVRSGQSLRFLARSDHRNLNVGKFMNWVRKDPTRKKLFDEAQAIAAEVLMMETVEIADGMTEDNDPSSLLPAEVTRDKLRIDTRMKLASFWDAKKYGDVKRVEMTTKDLTDEHLRTLSLDELQKLVVEGEFTREDSPNPNP